MASDDEGEDYHFFGTPIEDEEETRAGQHRKAVTDPAATRALPLHKQVRTGLGLAGQQLTRRFAGRRTAPAGVWRLATPPLMLPPTDVAIAAH